MLTSRKFTSVLLAAAFVATVSSASAVTLASWTFEISIPTTAGPLTPEVGGGSATGGTGGVWSNPVGNGSAESWSSTAWDVNDYAQFSVDGTGYDVFDVSWSQTSSNTGPKDFSFAYSLDGSLFVPAYTYAVLANAAPNTWSSVSIVTGATYAYSVDLPTAVSGTIYFRLVDISTVSANGGTVAAGGTSRIDTVSIAGTATPVPEPSTYAAIFAGITFVGAGVARRRRN